MHRDEYLFDILAEAGLDITDPGDWVTISNFLSEPEVQAHIEG